MFKVKKIILLFMLVGLFACQKEYVYDVNIENIQLPNAGKTKLKTEDQYIAILYANLFQTAISPNELVDVNRCIESIGDKELVHEIIISNFMNKPDVIIPADSLMRVDVDTFMFNTYERFLVREMTEAERTYWNIYINSTPQVTPELVYFSFALSNEYLYY